MGHIVAAFHLVAAFQAQLPLGLFVVQLAGRLDFQQRG